MWKYCDIVYKSVPYNKNSNNNNNNNNYYYYSVNVFGVQVFTLEVPIMKPALEHKSVEIHALIIIIIIIINELL